jgi:hypothetical protein
VGTIRTVRRHPSGVLLAVQLAGLLVYPFLGDQTAGRVVLQLFGLGVLVLAVMAVRSTPALTWVSVIIGLPVVVLTVLELTWRDSSTVALWSATLHAAFYAYTAYALIRYMFDDDRITRDELIATGATFTVVAWGWAYAYTAVQIVWPGSFAAAENSADPRTWVELLFLSVTTLSSTGLSDIVPVRPHARSVVMLEQIAGMLYLAIVVARVTALTVAQSARTRR